MTGAFRCADGAESRGESLAGTASRADRFVLIEFPTPWPKKAVEMFDDGLRAELEAVCAVASAKVLLIRRAGAKTPARRRWAVCDASARRALWGEWESMADLRELVDVVGASPTDRWSDEPVVLVCTHARHDTCCGVRGRPLALALTESHDDLVWESSHVGGHRFSGNVVFPLDGTYYGRVGAEEGPDVVEAHLNEEVSGSHLRGFSRMEPAAQAVAVEAHKRWGPAGPDDLAVASVEALERDRWRVELAGGDVLPTSITAEVERVVGPDARMSCLADPLPTEAFVIRTLDASSQ